ncbi:hypothetical protein BVRB_3g063490 [Beta vulgaris subsp. vulgaris]|nr:hypothetical protein BVRB_3g063490 [Beta vulgaris subsp. vulgaris]
MGVWRRGRRSGEGRRCTAAKGDRKAATGGECGGAVVSRRGERKMDVQGGAKEP